MSPAVDNLVALIRLTQKELSDEDRLDMWDEIKIGYCKDCGRPLKHGEMMCHCNNDD